MSESEGKKIFLARCACCHTLELNGKHKVGPNLYGFYNQRSCTAEGFKFSDGLIEKGAIWNDENLNKFLENPRKDVPGTRMLFAGLKKPQEREDIIAFFKKLYPS